MGELDLTAAIQAAGDAFDRLVERDDIEAIVRTAAPHIERAVRADDELMRGAVVLMFERFMVLARDRTRLGADGVAKVNAAYQIAKRATEGQAS